MITAIVVVLIREPSLEKLYRAGEAINRNLGETDIYVYFPGSYWFLLHRHGLDGAFVTFKFHEKSSLEMI